MMKSLLLLLFAPAAFGQILCDQPIPDPVTPNEIKNCLDVAPNEPPNINNPGPQVDPVGVPLTLQLLATDPDGDPLLWSYSGLPDGLEGDQNGLISGTPTIATSYPVATAVADDGEASAFVEWLWTIEAAPPPPECNDGEDNDNDGFVDLADVGCDGPTDNDETDPVQGGVLAFAEVPVDDAPGDTEPFGVACADFNQNGFIECVISEHEGGTHTRWEWNGSRFAYLDALPITKCDLDIYATDANLDGNVDLFCAYVNWPASKYVPFSGGDLDPSQAVSAVCGSGRLDNCAPVLEDGSILARAGHRFTFDGGEGGKASQATTGFTNGTNSYTQVGGWFIDGVAIDLTPYLAANETVSVKHTVAEDFNGDGLTDILLSPHQQSGSATQLPFVLLAQSGGGFAQPATAKRARQAALPGLQLHQGQWNPPKVQPKFIDGNAAYWHSYGNIDAADIDDNGTQDIVVFGGTYTDMYQVWLGNGDGTFTRSDALWVIPQGDGSGPGGGQDKPAGRIVDFDGDGCLDLFVTYPRAPAGSAYAKAIRSLRCD